MLPRERRRPLHYLVRSDPDVLGSIFSHLLLVFKTIQARPKMAGKIYHSRNVGGPTTQHSIAGHSPKPIPLNNTPNWFRQRV